ncbi:MFS transporter [Herbaspirillum robiniae]|uniref:MFS transporter n=1 Tax=Herbaspirillum robiniae TaxID=2014887 RepID=UPI003D76B0AF
MSNVRNGLIQKVLVLLGGTLTVMGTVMVAPVFPKMIQHFSGHPNAMMMLQIAIAGPSLAIALLSPVSGWLTDRFGRKKILMISISMFCLFGVAPIYTDHLETFVGLRLMLGCAEAFIMTSCMALIIDYWTGKEREKVLSLQIISMSLMGALMNAVGGALGDISWQTPFYMYLAPAMLLPLIWINLRESVGSSNPIESSDNSPESTILGPVLIGYCTIFVVMVMAFLVHLQMPVLLTNLGVTSSFHMGLTAGASVICGVVGSFFWAPLMRKIGMAGCNFLVFILFAVAIMLFHLATEPYTLVVAAILHGTAIGLGAPNAIAPVMASLSQKARGLGMGLNMMSLYLGQFFSPIIVGWIGGFTGGLHGALAGLSTFCLFYALCWLAVYMRTRNWQTAKHEAV